MEESGVVLINPGKEDRVMPAGIQKQEKKFRLNRRNFHFSNAERN
jgi:hypothetical protein